MACQIGQSWFTDAVELPDAFGYGAETVFRHFEVNDRVIVVVLVGLDHPEPLPRVMPDRARIAEISHAVFGTNNEADATRRMMFAVRINTIKNMS